MFSLQIFYSIIVGFLLFGIIGASGLAYWNYKRDFNILYIVFVSSIIGFFCSDIFCQNNNLCSLSDYIIYEKTTNFFLLLTGISLIQLIFTITQYKSKILGWLFTIPLCIFIVVNFVLPYGFYYSTIEKIELVRLPFGIFFNTPSGSTSVAVPIISIYLILLGVFIIRSAIYAYKNNNKSSGNVIILAFMPSVIIQFISTLTFMASGRISLPGILLGDLSLLYVAIALGYKNFSDAIIIVGTTKSLVESEVKFNALADSAIIGIMVYQDDKFIYANKASETICGYTKKELLECNFWSIAAPEYQNIIKERGKKRQEGENLPPALEFKIITKSGEERWVCLNGNKIEVDGKPAGLVSIEDITTRKISQELLEENREKYRALSEATFESIFLSEKGICIEQNKTAELKFGYSNEEALGRYGTEWIIPEHRDIVMANMLAGYEEPYEATALRKDGTTFHAVLRGKMMNYRGKKVRVTSLTDISDQKNAEESFRLSSMRYETIFNKASVGIVSMTIDGIIQKANESFAKMHGYSIEELRGMSIYSLDTPDSHPFIDDRSERINAGESMQFEIGHFHKDGHVLNLEVSTNCIEIGNEIYILSFYNDISERKLAEAALKESEEKYRSLIQYSADPIFTFNSDGTYRFVNDTFAKTFGRSQAEFIGTSPYDYFPKEDAEQRLKTVYGVFATGKGSEIAVHVRTNEGKDRYFLTMADPIKDESGKVLWVSCISKDITERRMAEDALRQSEEKYRLLAEHMTDTIWLMDLELHTYYISPSIEKMRGFTADEIIGMPLEKQMPADSLRKALDAYTAEMDYLKLHPDHTFVVSLELEFYRKDGSIYCSENTFSLVRDYDGIPKAILGEGRDITARKLADAKIKQLSRAVEQSPVSILIVDLNGIIQYANPKVAEMYGESIGKRVGEVLGILRTGTLSEDNKENILQSIKDGNEWKGEIKSLDKDGKVLWEYISISPIKEESGGFYQYLIIVEDVTSRKKLEANLIYEKEKAEEMSRLKSNFLANMSHELRTPMIGILGYSEILIDEVKDASAKDSLEIIYTSGRRLMDTLNLILHLSRIEAGRLEVESETFDIVRTVEESCKLFERVATKKSLYLQINSNYASLDVVSDEKIFREIINNLVNNAIKFTDRGGITVEIKTEISGTYNWLVIQVIDTGIGIAKDNQELIWEEFRQVSEGHNRSFEGTGLGLTITKKFVEKLKGTIVVESEVNAGSIFTLRFPLISKNKIESPKIKPRETPSKLVISKSGNLPKVLYVEDDTIAVQIVVKVLKNICEIDIVDNSLSALEKVQECSYAAILMDINLGHGHDGVQTTKAIRNMEQYKHVPIVAITAYAMVGDEEEFRQAGCSHYISKPFSSTDLRTLVSEVLHN